MAQGAIKKSKSSGSSRRINVLGPKKGARTIAPKRAFLVKQKKITKKYSAGLTAKTERHLAEKAGHLEMIAGGKKRGKDVGEGKKDKQKK